MMGVLFPYYGLYFPNEVVGLEMRSAPPRLDLVHESKRAEVLRSYERERFQFFANDCPWLEQ